MREYQKESTFPHIRWMCDQMLLMEDKGKLNRWLGFIQGTLWRDGIRTIDQMREEVRKIKDELA